VGRAVRRSAREKNKYRTSPRPDDKKIINDNNNNRNNNNIEGKNASEAVGCAG